MWDSIPIPILVVSVAALIAAWTDLRSFRVYNVLTVPLVLTGMLYHTSLAGWQGLVTSSTGMILGFCILIIPYALGLMGAGDVKLLAGIGAWLGARWVVNVFMATSVVTGIFAVVVILWRGELRQTWTALQIIFMRFAVLGLHVGKDDLIESAVRAPNRRMRAIPFAAAVPIGIAATLYLLHRLSL